MTFFASAALLTLIAVMFALAPWALRRRTAATDTAADRRAALLEVTRARRAELQRERELGTVDEATFSQLQQAQERQLLSELEEAERARSPVARRGAVVLLAVAVLIPIAAFTVYQQFGNAPDWRLQELLEQAYRERGSGADNSATLAELAKGLDQRVEEGVDTDGRRRFLLARLSLETGQFRRAADHYRELHEQFPEDSTMTAQYAQALFLAQQRQLTPEVERLAQLALSQNGDQTTALGLLGIAAFEQGQYGQAVTHWQRLITLLPPGSPERQIIAQGIVRAQAELGTDLAGSTAAATEGPRLDITIDVADALKEGLPSGATLFVFARAVEGPPMPLAAVRLQPDSWPVSVTLDENSAMMAGAGLASVEQVVVTARLSRSGQPQAGAGDLEGQSDPVATAPGAHALQLIIDRVL